MACFHPLTAGRANPEIHGRTKLVFGNAIKAEHQILKVGCGQCIGCRLDHSLQWAARCMHESKNYDSNSFITLTYSDEHLPSDMSLSVSEFQRFMKRLRKTLSPQRIKYFHCGEYSPRRPKFISPNIHPDTVPDGLRPHYHAAIFGFSFPDKVLWSVRDDVRLYSSDLLNDIWGKGFCTVGNLTYESAAYVARYSLKKINGQLETQPGPSGLLPYERVCPITGNITQVAKEHVSMSNGIGREFYDKYSSDIYPRDYLVTNGHKTRPPRYYDNLYEQVEPAIMESLKHKRCEEMEKFAADNTPARLRQREKVKQAQLQMLKREGIQ